MTLPLRALVSCSVLLIAAAPLPAQSGREACADAARALVRQQTSWDEARYGATTDTLRWRASDGTRGTCRLDSRGRVYEVKVEQWGSGGDIIIGPPGGGGELTEERGMDRRGDDYTNFGARSLSDCKSACRRDGRCLAYSFSVRDGRCWLKSRVNSPHLNRDMITGYKSSGSGGGGSGGRLTEEWGYDRRGNDYTSFRADGLGDCQSACRRDGRCRAYTFDTRNRACYLKDRVNSGQADSGMVTGYKEY